VIRFLGIRGHSWSIAARLTAWYTATAFSLVLVATGLLYWTLVQNMRDEDQRRLADKVQVLRTLLHERGSDAAALKEVEWEWAAREYEQVYVRVLTDRGETLVETPGMATALPASALTSLPPSSERPAEVRGIDGRRFRTVSASAGGTPAPRQIVQVAIDLAHEQEILAAYRRRLWLVLGLALAASAFVGHAIARRGVRPLEHIARTARDITSTRLDARIDHLDLPGEVATIAITFNEMLARLQDSFERLSRFSADIAHELRTPVNNLRGETEVALTRARTPEEYRDILTSSLEEYERLTRLIDSLLFLARAEHSETRIVREHLNLRRELQTVAEFYEGSATEQGITLVVDVPPTPEIEADRTLFQRAVGNLIGNALAHTPVGGTVTIQAIADGSYCQIHVVDTGRGVPAEDLPYVFDRFYRADKSRASNSGNLGLGLAIVRSIAQLHGGRVELASQLGHGTRATLILPT
jgi:two-component system, OmpR family, heavy metal sensor histidine kinase CusS